jgi:ubiquinone/menaquinone biosynthesis C-methylase UbiE
MFGLRPHAIDMSDYRVHHPLFARAFARVRPAMDTGGVAEHRQRLLAGLSGRVLEIGAGDGGNFAYYPAEVDQLLAVEPEPYLRARAELNAQAAKVPVTVLDAVAEQLPLADGSVDAAVTSLVLCSVADQRIALDELRRVVRPGGQLRFYEHVRAETAPTRAVQTVLDKTVWPHVAGGCHMGRDTLAAIEQAGFRIDTVEKIRFPDIRIPFPASLHVLGSATPIADRDGPMIDHLHNKAAET